MRPAHRSHDLAAVLVFAGVAALLAWMAFGDESLSAEQSNLAAAAMKSHDAGLFTGDPLFSRENAWRCGSPGFGGIVEGLLALGGWRDPLLPFRLLVGPLVLLYLCGAYALFRSQCRSWSVSAFVAILSVATVPALSGAFWGVGSLSSITPEGLCVCLSPPIVLAFLLWREYRMRLLVFLLAGAMGNIHFASAVNLVIVLAMCHLVERRMAAGAWLGLAPLCLAAAVGASPFLAFHFHPIVSPASGMLVDPTAAARALHIAEPAVLFPQLLGDAPNWLLRAAALALPSVLLVQVRRFRPRKAVFGITFAIGTIVIALGFQGVSQLVAPLLGGRPPFIGFAQSSALLMLPLYVLFAQTLAGLFRLVRPHRGLLQAACAVAMTIWMLPSDNVRVLRHGLYKLATVFCGEEDKPRKVQRIEERRQADMELKALARWAADNTPKEAVFLTDRGEFRALCGRGIVAGGADWRCFYPNDRAAMGRWGGRWERQAALLHPTGDKLSGKDIALFFSQLSDMGDLPPDGAGRYVIAPAQQTVKEQGYLVAESSELWGRHYRLYRLLPPSG